PRLEKQQRRRRSCISRDPLLLLRSAYTGCCRTCHNHHLFYYLQRPQYPKMNPLTSFRDLAIAVMIPLSTRFLVVIVSYIFAGEPELAVHAGTQEDPQNLAAPGLDHSNPSVHSQAGLPDDPDTLPNAKETQSVAEVKAVEDMKATDDLKNDDDDTGNVETDRSDCSIPPRSDVRPHASPFATNDTIWDRCFSLRSRTTTTSLGFSLFLPGDRVPSPQQTPGSSWNGGGAWKSKSASSSSSETMIASKRRLRKREKTNLRRLDICPDMNTNNAIGPIHSTPTPQTTLQPTTPAPRGTSIAGALKVWDKMFESKKSQSS
ncbi:hypothetical protein BCR34DRAFT_639144, partial [Clohesyomyces aquaticus]